MPSAPATSHKGRSQAGEGAGSCSEVPVSKLFGTRYMEGTLRVEGGAEISGLISGTGWGGLLGAAVVVEACP